MILRLIVRLKILVIILWLIWLNIQESVKQKQSDDEDFLVEYTIYWRVINSGNLPLIYDSGNHNDDDEDFWGEYTGE